MYLIFTDASPYIYIYIHIYVVMCMGINVCGYVAFGESGAQQESHCSGLLRPCRVTPTLFPQDLADLLEVLAKRLFPRKRSSRYICTYYIYIYMYIEIILNIWDGYKCT